MQNKKGKKAEEAKYCLSRDNNSVVRGLSVIPWLQVHPSPEDNKMSLQPDLSEVLEVLQWLAIQFFFSMGLLPKPLSCRHVSESKEPPHPSRLSLPGEKAPKLLINFRATLVFGTTRHVICKTGLVTVMQLNCHVWRSPK